MTEPNWREFEQRRQAEAAPNPERDRFAELCAQVFSASGPGGELLKAMRAITIEQRTPENAPEGLLREMEAKRRFVTDLERARDRGLELLAGKAKSKT